MSEPHPYQRHAKHIIQIMSMGDPDGALAQINEIQRRGMYFEPGSFQDCLRGNGFKPGDFCDLVAVAEAPKPERVRIKWPKATLDEATNELLTNASQGDTIEDWSDGIPGTLEDGSLVRVGRRTRIWDKGYRPKVLFTTGGVFLYVGCNRRVPVETYYGEDCFVPKNSPADVRTREIEKQKGNLARLYDCVYSVAYSGHNMLSPVARAALAEIEKKIVGTALEEIIKPAPRGGGDIGLLKRVIFSPSL